MKTLKERKKEFLKQQAALKAFDQEMSLTRGKKDDLAKKLDAIESELKSLAEKQNEAILQAAKGEGQEKTLEKIEAKIVALEVRKRSISAALDLVRKEMADFEQPRLRLVQDFETIQEKLWRSIFESELEALQPQYERTLAAFTRANIQMNAGANNLHSIICDRFKLMDPNQNLSGVQAALIKEYL